MSDPKKSEPEKARQSRSFGTFLVVLLGLVILLVWFGGGNVNKPDELSQDEYLDALYAGRVESQQIKSEADRASTVEGVYHRASGVESRRFTTEFTDAAQVEPTLRSVMARRPVRIGADQLESAIRSGYYAPVHVDAVAWVQEIEPPTTGPPSSGDSRSAVAEPKRDVRRGDRLFVEVLARSAETWEGPDPAPFPLQKSSGSLWLDVDLRDVADVGALTSTLASAGASVERHSFDITRNGGTTHARASTLWNNFLILFLPWIVIFAVLWFFMRQLRSQGGAGGVMNFGRSRAQMYTKENRTNVTFDDIAGAREAKSEVREIVEFLKNPGRFQRIGGRIPRGVLLVGPPGCGKTLLAKAIAGEAEVPFFSISGSDFVEMFVGVGASRVRDLFKQARDNSPCIIFLDEIDAVGRRRGSGMGGGHDEREQTLNAILVEMDGFGTDEGIIVVAATNRPDVLDPALLRPGRFDREVTIDLPDKEDRKAILEVHLRRVRTGTDVDAEVLARSTPSYSGAELAAIVNEAAIMAVLARRDAVSMEDLEEARDKVRYGRQKESRKIAEEDRRITAYHEAGHAVLAALLPETDPPHKVTIIRAARRWA
ncbi:MAG: ATP-dependent zinc metalloprotease FtsH [Planctomycetota bacterium]